ncbi:hypothetical protein [Acidisoma sp. C75]
MSARRPGSGRGPATGAPSRRLLFLLLYGLIVTLLGLLAIVLKLTHHG